MTTSCLSTGTLSGPLGDNFCLRQPHNSTISALNYLLSRLTSKTVIRGWLDYPRECQVRTFHTVK